MRANVIDFAEALKTRRLALDLADAWARRRAEMQHEAELLVVEVTAHSAAVQEAVDRFHSLGMAAIARLRDLTAQMEAGDEEIARLTGQPFQERGVRE